MARHVHLYYKSGMRIPTIVILGFLASLLAHVANAQEETDFLFGIPRGAISIRGGYMTASANSAVYDFFAETLTIEKGDFNTPVFGLDVALVVHPRIDVLVGFELSKSTTRSEYRDFEEDDGSPIRQTTELSMYPFSGSVKFYLTPRGRDISRFAFVPSKARAYVGGGAGLVGYRLAQTGDFVDFVDLAIFTEEFKSTGFGTEAHAFFGVDVQLKPTTYLSFEGRYMWADAGLSGGFVGFDSIDLSGLRITAGISFSF